MKIKQKVKIIRREFEKQPMCKPNGKNNISKTLENQTKS